MKTNDFGVEVGVGGKPENTQGISLADAARAVVGQQEELLTLLKAKTKPADRTFSALDL